MYDSKNKLNVIKNNDSGDMLLYTSEDLTGRKRIASNLLFSWGGHFIFIVTGFILPRMINDYVGQFSLGIWDFAWSLIHYFDMASLGIGASVNRYVAKYRAVGDIESLREAVSSVLFIQVAIALFVLSGTAALSWLLPVFFADRLGPEMKTAQWVVFFLGTSLSIQMGFDTFHGVMTGCHRWDLHNIINGSSRAITVAIMIISLVLRGNLRSLAIIFLCTTFMTEFVRMHFAFRICRQLRIHIRYVSWSEAKRMLSFGCKTVIVSIPALIIVQTCNILIIKLLSPIALAVFSRPMHLVQRGKTFIDKFAFILTPTAGSIQVSGRSEELGELLVETTRFGVALTLPMMILLSLYGDLLLLIWMGPQYANGLLIAMLAIGLFLPIAQSPAMRILIGMNLHGKIGLINLAVILIGFGIGIAVVNAHGWSLFSMAVIVTLPLVIGDGILVPLYACRKLNLPFLRYLERTFTEPFICAVIFGLCLIYIRFIFKYKILETLVLGSILASSVLAILYWKRLLTEEERKRIIRSAREKLNSIRS